MKIYGKQMTRLFYGFILCAALMSCDKDKETITLKNNKIQLGFHIRHGGLQNFSVFDKSVSFLDPGHTSGSLWELDLFHSPEEIETIGSSDATGFDYRFENANTLKMTWYDFEAVKNPDFKVVAMIKVKDSSSLSFWSIEVKGIEEQQISKLVYPIVSGIKDLGDEHLAVPKWLGVKMKEPRIHLAKSGTKKMHLEYPGRMSLQCMALYNDSEKMGLYTASNDSLAYRKDFTYSIDSLNNLTYYITNYPSLDSNSSSYAPAYEAVIGGFEGDWLSAAFLYRHWGETQSWSKKSRFKNGLTPKSLEQTALWEWNRGKSGNVLHPAKDLKHKLGLPVNVFWHWWHGCSYDDGFPEYFPPREGKESFVNAVKSAQEEGIGSIVYMNQMQWGTQTKSWKEENALAYAVKDLKGNTNTHTYNIFTDKSLTTMCMGTRFWKDKYASLSDKAINNYGTNGVYMDQACFSILCYDKSHGHSIGGGNYWLKNFARLTEQIRSVFPENKDVFLAGEGVSEAWLPYLDAFLTLQVSMERYAGDNGWEPIPFFQAVYHPYAITYGNYSSLLVPPYDSLWPKKYAPEDPLALLDEKYGKQFLMEQARSFVWGLQPTISNYQSFLSIVRKKEMDYLMELARVRNNGLKYLLEGQFERTPELAYPTEEIDMSRLSIYAGKTGNTVSSFKKHVDMVYSGTWRSDDNQLGIAIASISDMEVPLSFKMDANDYGLRASGKVNLIDSDGKRLLSEYSDGSIQVEVTLKPRQVCIIEIEKVN